MICFDCFGLKFRFRWLSAVVSIFLFLVFNTLGFWQFGKAQDKLATLEKSNDLAVLEPVNLRELSFGGPTSDRLLLHGKNVFINGHYLNGQNIFLIYKHYQEMIGYEVITPFRVREDGGIALVSRGWATAPSPAQLEKKVLPVLGDIRVTGQIYVPDSYNERDKPKIDKIKWPLIAREISTAQLTKFLDGPIYPYVLRINEGEAGALVRYWPVINPDLGMHFAYSMQWFGMALSVLAIFIITCSSLRQRFTRWFS